MEWLTLALLSGAIIGFILALVGGGGSILAVPLLVYVVGVASTHHAIGTAAVAVAINAALALLLHMRSGTVKWRCATVFAGAGMLGAAIGAELGKAVDGAILLTAFGGLMIVVGALMIGKRKGASDASVRLDRHSAGHLLPRLIPAGLIVGILAGFFGIGGGFLIVPALIFATGMPIGMAIGTSLVAITALGATTAASYSLSGLVDWRLVGLLAVGGLVGASAGVPLGRLLTRRKRALEIGFASLVIATGGYIIAG